MMSRLRSCPSVFLIRYPVGILNCATTTAAIATTTTAAIATTTTPTATTTTIITEVKVTAVNR